jgi:hypothetical protein
MIFARIVAALKHTFHRTPWTPFSSNPTKNGIYFVCFQYGEDRPHPPGYHRIEAAIYDTQRGWSLGSEHDMTFTHWMPVPNPPARSENP